MLLRLLSVINTFIIIIPTLCRSSKDITPIILIPGDGGSQIQAKLNKTNAVHYVCYKHYDDWFDLWLSIESLVPFIIDCWVDNMKLVYDPKTRTTSNAPGVSTRIPGFGNTSTVEWLDPFHAPPTGYFKDIVEAILPMGYERSVSIKGAPFDFRKAPNEHKDYFERLEKMVVDMYNDLNQRKVMLMAHSMGGPMITYFLNKMSQSWKDKYIHSVLSLSGAWGGSIKAVKVYAAGDNLGVPVIQQTKVRREQRSVPSLAFLLPSPKLWNESFVLVQTPEKNYTTANFKDFFQALKLPHAYMMYEDTKNLIVNTKSLGVKMNCLYGVNVKTVESLVYKSSSDFPDNPSYIYGEGDGTVNLLSSELPLQWAKHQTQEVNMKAFKGVDHMNILRNSEVIEYIKSILKNTQQENKMQRKASEYFSKMLWQNHRLIGNERIKLENDIRYTLYRIPIWQKIVYKYLKIQHNSIYR